MEKNSLNSMVWIRLGALGDVLRLLPLAEPAKRKWGAGRLAWVAGAAVAPLLREHPAIDQVIELPRLGWKNSFAWLRQARELRRHRFDLCFELQGLAKSGFLAWATRAPRRLGLAPGRAREGSAWALTEQRPPALLSRYEEALDLLGLGWSDWASGAESLRDAWRLRGPRQGILLHPGTSERNRYKRWAPADYAETAEILARKTNEPVWLHGARNEAPLLEEIAAEAPAARIQISESLPELLRNVAAARLFLGGDTGPLHAALLAGTPALALYGGSDPRTYALPPAAPHRIVRVPVPCSPCKHRTCATRECLEWVEPKPVAEAALSLLESSG